MGKRTYNAKRLSLERGDLLSVILLSPTLLIVIVVLIIPFVYGLSISLFDYNVGKALTPDSFVGLGNYAQMFKDKVVLKSLSNTVLFAVLATAGDMALGTAIAVLLSKLKPTVSNILRAICLMPLLVSPIIVGLIWRYMYDPQSGLLYWFLGLFGIGTGQFPGLTSSSTALISVVIAHWWQVTPFVILVVTAGLASIPQEQYEAAQIDGATGFDIFFKVTLPQLTRMYMVILVVSGVDTVKVFDIIYALTQGGPANSTVSLSIYAYKNAFEMYKMGYAMAIAILTIAITFIMFGIPFLRVNRKEEKEA